MKIDVVIPSCNRYFKLISCLDSIEKYIQSNVMVYVYFSSHKEIIEFNYKKDWLKIRLFENYCVPNFWNSHIKNMDADVMMFANDDICLFNSLFRDIEEIFINNFPDYDGILGLNQINIDSPTKLDSAFCVVGVKFADRFLDRQIMCPDYYRFFSDKELGLFAKSINKFYYDKNIGIIHNHPCTNLSLIDQTHKEVRKYLKQDEQTFNKRQTFGFLWGRNTNLINQ